MEQMKRQFKRILSLLLAVQMVLAVAVPVNATETANVGNESYIPFEKFFWQDSDGKFTCSYQEATVGNEYMLFVVPGIYTDIQKVDSDDLVKDLLYINQKTADSSSVVFSGFVPSRLENSTVIISGTDMSSQILGYMLQDGFELKGYTQDNQGATELEDALLIAPGTSWEDTKKFLPKNGYAEIYSEYTGTIFAEVAFDWGDTAPEGFDNQQPGNVYPVEASVTLNDSRMPMSMQALLTNINANITVHRTNSIPVELTISKTKTVYQKGEIFTVDDISVKAIFDDNTVRNVIGWTTNVDQLSPSKAGEYTLTVTYSESGYTVSKDIPLYLKDNAAQDICQVSFETRGGSYVAPAYVEKGGQLTLPEAPEKNGYVFGGWYCERQCETQLQSQKRPFFMQNGLTRPRLCLAI